MHPATSPHPCAVAPIPGLRLDHLVIAADTLEQGVRWCEGVLGVTPGPGGRHPLMGTHNRLLRLAGPCGHPAGSGPAGMPVAAEAPAYLEIIAIDPQAPPPPHPRWFGLDRRPPGAPPQLVHWVLRVQSLTEAAQGLREAGVEPGTRWSMSREHPQGAFVWQLTVPADGMPPAGGAVPSLIEWSSEHPAARMPPSGLAWSSLSLSDVPAAARPWLAAPGVGWADAAVQGSQAAGLSAVLLGPRGRVVLRGPVSAG